MQFSYQARDNNGKMNTGILDAEDEADAALVLSNQGMTPIAITQVKVTDVNLNIEWLEPKVSLEDKIMLSRQMYSLMKAGLPLMRAIRGLADSSSHPRLKTILNKVKKETEAILEDDRIAGLKS